MDPINEAYNKAIIESRGPVYDPWMNRKNQLTADLASRMFDGDILPRKFNHNWWEIANMFGQGDNVTDISASDKKKFLKDLEALGLHSTDNEKNIDDAMFKKFMKNWIK